MSAEVWNVMTRTRGGTVSLLKNLTKDEARAVMQRLRRPGDEGDPWVLDRKLSVERARRERHKKYGSSSVYLPMRIGHSPGDGALAQIECWGPADETLVVWPKPADWDERWAAAIASLDAEEAALEKVT